MTQIRLHFTATKADAERAYAALEPVFEDDGLPLAIIEIDEDRDIHEVSIYTDTDEADVVESRMSALLAEISLSVPIAREALPDIDWVSRSLEGLKPVRAGRFFVHGAHDRDQRRQDDIAIEIEAGLAFGTGHHGTTAGCLEMLESAVGQEHPQNALDLGTGSAVLAIALAKLARVKVLATDIDPVAIDVAAANVALNGVSEQVQCVTATGFNHPVFAARGPFDLIVANILAGPLIELAPEMVRQAKADGSLILSGILDRQEQAVVDAYVAAGFRHVRTTHLEGWVTIHLKS